MERGDFNFFTISLRVFYESNNPLQNLFNRVFMPQQMNLFHKFKLPAKVLRTQNSERHNFRKLPLKKSSGGYCIPTLNVYKDIL